MPSTRSWTSSLAQPPSQPPLQSQRRPRRLLHRPITPPSFHCRRLHHHRRPRPHCLCWANWLCPTTYRPAPTRLPQHSLHCRPSRCRLFWLDHLSHRSLRRPSLCCSLVPPPPHRLPCDPLLAPTLSAVRPVCHPSLHRSTRQHSLPTTHNHRLLIGLTPTLQLRPSQLHFVQPRRESCMSGAERGSTSWRMSGVYRVRRM